MTHSVAGVSNVILGEYAPNPAAIAGVFVIIRRLPSGFG